MSRRQMGSFSCALLGGLQKQQSGNGQLFPNTLAGAGKYSTKALGILPKEAMRRTIMKLDVVSCIDKAVSHRDLDWL